MIHRQLMVHAIGLIFNKVKNTRIPASIPIHAAMFNSGARNGRISSGFNVRRRQAEKQTSANSSANIWLAAPATSMIGRLMTITKTNKLQNIAAR